MDFFILFYNMAFNSDKLGKITNMILFFLLLLLLNMRLLWPVEVSGQIYYYFKIKLYKLLSAALLSFSFYSSSGAR